MSNKINMNSKVNSISILVDLEGKGLVNYNGDRVPNRFVGQMIHNGKVVKAGSFGKEHIYRDVVKDGDGNNKIVEVPKKIISSNLLRKEIMGDENSVNADKLSKNDKLRVALFSQDNVIARGYMSEGRSNMFKRKGAVTVTDAQQTSDTVTWLETRTKEGERNEKSMHFKETCGDISYQSEITIDVKKMQFISVDDNYDRISMLEKDVKGFIQHIDGRYGEGNAEFGNWATTHLNVMGEQGIVLSSKVVSNIIREVIKGIFSINIQRSGSYAKTSSVKIALGHEGDSIDLLSEPNYVQINSIADYDKLVEGEQIGVDFISVEPPVIEKTEKKDKEETK